MGLVRREVQFPSGEWVWIQHLADNIYVDEATGDIYECVGDNLLQKVAEAN